MSKSSTTNREEHIDETAQHQSRRRQSRGGRGIRQEAEQAFVNSPQGKAKIRKGANVRPEEETDLEQAEQRAKAHGKNDDSKTTKMKYRPPAVPAARVPARVLAHTERVTLRDSEELSIEVDG